MTDSTVPPAKPATAEWQSGGYILIDNPIEFMTSSAYNLNFFINNTLRELKWPAVSVT